VCRDDTGVLECARIGADLGERIVSDHHFSAGQDVNSVAEIYMRLAYSRTLIVTCGEGRCSWR
jgi:hypothetical protein